MSEDEKNGLKDSHELYCDMNYLTPFYTFKNLDFAPLYDVSKSDTSSASLTDVVSEIDNDIPDCSSSTGESVSSKAAQSQKEMSLLDLFSGCGAMSTGLCLGAALSGSTLVTKWAVDLNKHACESLQKNHPETKVRNETAEEYLSLLKEWKKLCDTLLPSVDTIPEGANAQSDEDGDEDEEELDDDVFEVEELLDIRFDNEQGLLFKVRWKGYGLDEDLWEPYDNLMMGSEERVKEFVVKGYHSELLPLPVRISLN